MLASASAVVTDLKAKFNVMANQRKFPTLPDEILSIIFEMIYRSLPSGHGKIVTELSLVSRRFRNVIVGLPVLWSKISLPYLPRKSAELLASRAKAHPLSLSLDDEYSWNSKEPEDVRILGMYELAVSLSSRIRKLSIFISEFSTPSLDAIQQACSDAHFPSLSELTLNCYAESPRRCRTLCREWNMPSLTTLSVVNILPTLPHDVTLNIQTLSIDANKDTNLGHDDSWRPAEIIAFLFSFSSVKDLHVSTRLFNVRIQNQQSDPRMKMESVERLTLHLPNTKSATESNILHLIKFPSLTSFKLDLGLSDLEDLDEALKHVKFLATPASVTDVTLAVGAEMDSVGRAPLHVIEEWCNRFEGLKSFTLDSDRSRSHGLLAFTGSIDVLKVVNRKEGGEGMPDCFLSKLMPLWVRPHRTAVIGVEENGDGIDRTETIRFIDSDSDSESD
ncbi:hypothetical protein SCHPADRAFT_529643 [Schizopora paradoxa]|uniref:Uncharacterized protein n=1 Tax=Schizopora paradoxa TaxID=27342 RepID=A0A0H2REE1_9AGAM|nr:hypothetical protein SCHPADRAFT_529643 [Schizopora paradoxa]